jgi:hypothetical protein
MNVAGNLQVDEDWGDMRPSVENPAALDQLQDLQYVAMGCDMANDDVSPPFRHRDHIIPDFARVAQDVPIQTHVASPAPVSADLTLMHTISNNTLIKGDRRI